VARVARAGDLYVTDLDGTARSTTLRRDATGRTGGCEIEERLGEGLLEIADKELGHGLRRYRDIT